MSIVKSHSSSEIASINDETPASLKEYGHLDSMADIMLIAASRFAKELLTI